MIRLVALFVILVFGCSSYELPQLKDEPLAVRVPAWFPETKYPSDNEPTKLRIELGKILFYCS